MLRDTLADEVADHDAIGRQLVHAIRDALACLAGVLPENDNGAP